MSRIWRLRASLLTLVGALAVHQGRYLLAPPDHVHSDAHAYFAWAVPLLALLVLTALAEVVLRVSRGREGPPRLPPTCVVFVVIAFALLAIFGAQESLETLFVDGALPTANPLLTDGAWVSIPLALAVAAALALLLRGAALAIALIRGRSARRRPARRRLGRALDDHRPAGSGIARSLAPRGPPSRVGLQTA